MDPEEQHRLFCEVGKAIAPGMERQRARIELAFAPVRAWMIRELAPQPGDTVLELAAGIGDTGFDAAALVGEGGRLISTDFSPDMVELARRRGAALGLANVDYRVMDAEHLELDADSVDGVLCRFGYMLMPDPAAALSETRRVLRGGGRLALAVWSSAERNRWTTILAQALIERGHLTPPESGGLNPFGMASRERTRALIERAGFPAVRTEEVPIHLAVRDVDDYLRYVTEAGGVLAVALRGLSEDEREAITAHLADEFTRFAAEEGYELPGVALTAVAS